MSDATVIWPRKKREFHNHHFDSTIWNEFKFRPDDIIIATYAKSGTTWVQQIVSQLIFNGQEGYAVRGLRRYKLGHEVIFECSATGRWGRCGSIRRSTAVRLLMRALHSII